MPSEAICKEEAETKLRSFIGSFGSNSSDELNGLKLLLEATSLMRSQLPLESVLATMLDHAIIITHADRGMLLEPDADGVLQVRVARGRDSESLAPEAMNPSRSVLGRAIELESAVVNEDLNLADINLQSAQSVVLQLLRSSVVIPSFGAPRGMTHSEVAHVNCWVRCISIQNARPLFRRSIGKSSMPLARRLEAFLITPG